MSKDMSITKNCIAIASYRLHNFAIRSYRILDSLFNTYSYRHIAIGTYIPLVKRFSYIGI